MKSSIHVLHSHSQRQSVEPYVRERAREHACLLPTACNLAERRHSEQIELISVIIMQRGQRRLRRRKLGGRPPDLHTLLVSDTREEYAHNIFHMRAPHQSIGAEGIEVDATHHNLLQRHAALRRLRSRHCLFLRSR